MTLKFSDLRRIHRNLPRPQRAGDYCLALAPREPCCDWKPPVKFAICETVEELRFFSEWGEDPETHDPKLLWRLRGKHEIIFDLDLTRLKSVLP